MFHFLSERDDKCIKCIWEQKNISQIISKALEIICDLKVYIPCFQKRQIVMHNESFVFHGVESCVNQCRMFIERKILSVLFTLVPLVPLVPASGTGPRA